MYFRLSPHRLAPQLQPRGENKFSVLYAITTGFSSSKTLLAFSYRSIRKQIYLLCARKTFREWSSCGCTVNAGSKASCGREGTDEGEGIKENVISYWPDWCSDHIYTLKGMI